MKKTTALIIAVIALIVGHVLGYWIGINNPHRSSTNEVSSDIHMMPNGQIMKNDGTVMSMADMMSSMNAELKGKTGDDFDKAFLSEMIVHHQGAVEMAQAALTNAQHHEIKDLATAIISAQNKEIAEMQQWQKSWYNQ